MDDPYIPMSPDTAALASSPPDELRRSRLGRFRVDSGTSPDRPKRQRGLAEPQQAHASSYFCSPSKAGVSSRSSTSLSKIVLSGNRDLDARSATAKQDSLADAAYAGSSTQREEPEVTRVRVRIAGAHRESHRTARLRHRRPPAINADVNSRWFGDGSAYETADEGPGTAATSTGLNAEPRVLLLDRAKACGCRAWLGSSHGCL